MRRTTQKEMEGVLKLDGAGRFSHFIKRVVDEERAWGLWQDGWALMADAQGATILPLWPAKEYAELCATEDWRGFEPKEITLDSLLEDVALDLKAEDLRVAVFPIAAGRGVSISADEFCDALRVEMEKYDG